MIVTEVYLEGDKDLSRLTAELKESDGNTCRESACELRLTSTRFFVAAIPAAASHWPAPWLWSPPLHSPLGVTSRLRKQPPKLGELQKYSNSID